VLVVTGGSQGSLAINRVVAQWLDGNTLGDLQLLWLTGRATWHEFAARHAPPHLQVIPFLDPMADAWAVADLCVARAGMMTLAELCAWGIPSILMPLPTSAANHQAHNATAMATAGAAIVLAQQGLGLGEFNTAVDRLREASRRVTMAAAARSRG